MLDKISIGSYYDSDSLIHKMNSTIKIICTLIFALFSFFSYDLVINLLIISLLSILILLSRIPIKFYIISVLKIKWFLIFIFIINFIFEKNLYISFILVLRVIYVLIYTMMILYTTKQDYIIYGLQKTFSPLKLIKVPVNKMAFSIGLALRFIPNILNMASRILKSQINRGIYYKNLKFKDKIEILKSSIIPMFTLSMKKADIVSDVMELRLYDFNSNNLYIKTKINYFDIFVLVIHLMLLFLTIKKGVFI